MNHENLRKDTRKAVLPTLLLSGVLLAGCSMQKEVSAPSNHQAQTEPPSNKQTPKVLPKRVLNELYTEQGARIVILGAKRPIVLLQVVETCDQGNLVTITERVKNIGDKNGDGNLDYMQTTNMKIEYNNDSCADNLITQKDSRPIPVPAPNPNPESSTSTNTEIA